MIVATTALADPPQGGYGPGYGMGPGTLGNFGQGYGYGMGPGMMGSYGPGYGMGPGMMGGFGPDYGMGSSAMGGYATRADISILAQSNAARLPRSRTTCGANTGKLWARCRMSKRR